MKKYLIVLLPLVAIAAAPPAPFPVFLKSGFSSVLEFEEVPTRVVLGDSQNFQVERLDHSIVIKTLNAYAASNMFVYFRESEPRLFVLTASEDAIPTYYKKFETQVPPKVTRANESISSEKGLKAGGRILKSIFDEKKDYLTVSFEISADSKEVLKPNWGLIRLTFIKSALAPYKLWAEREDVQRDSHVKARLVFAKPNLPRDLKGVVLVIPLQGKSSPISLSFNGGRP